MSLCIKLNCQNKKSPFTQSTDEEFAWKCILKMISWVQHKNTTAELLFRRNYIWTPAEVYDRPVKLLVSADVQVKIGRPGRKDNIIHTEPCLIWLGLGLKTLSWLEKPVLVAWNTAGNCPEVFSKQNVLLQVHRHLSTTSYTTFKDQSSNSLTHNHQSVVY